MYSLSPPNSFAVNQKKLFWFGNPLLTLFIVLVINKEINCFAPNFWISFCVTLVFTICIWTANLFTINFLRKKLPALNQTKQRILSTFFAICFNTVFICLLLDIFFFHVFSQGQPYVINTTSFSIGLMASAFVLSVYEGLYFFEKWKEAMVSTEELKKANLQIQFDSLKNQVNPHFLFNSLNTLSSLIEEDKTASIKFVQKMSNVYRYLLQSNESELGTIEKELAFINAYCFMLKTRFEESLQIEINVDEKFKDYLIPTLTLQMLIENAVKHNVVSNESPLLVKIFVNTNQQLVVSNVLQKKTNLVKSNGVGLKNIRQRYELLGTQKMEVKEEKNTFIVCVPLFESGN